MKYRKTILLAKIAFFLQLAGLLMTVVFVMSQQVVMPVFLYRNDWKAFCIPPVSIFIVIGYPLILYGVFWGILVRASKRQSEVKVFGIVFAVTFFLIQRYVGLVEAFITNRRWDSILFHAQEKNAGVTLGELTVFYNMTRNVGLFFGSLAFATLCIAVGSGLMIETERKP